MLMFYNDIENQIFMIFCLQLMIAVSFQHWQIHQAIADKLIDEQSLGAFGVQQMLFVNKQINYNKVTISKIVIMENEANLLKCKDKQVCLSQQLQKVMRQYPSYPPCLANILVILHRLPGMGNESPAQFQNIIDSLCDEVLKLKDKTNKIEDLKKQEEVDIIIKDFVSLPHHLELVIDSKTQELVIKYRSIISQYFHYFIHRSTLKNITKLCIIFYKLICLQMLDKKIVNFFFLTLILSNQNLSQINEIKFIKICLRSLYQKKVLRLECQSERMTPVSQQTTNNHLYTGSNITTNSFSIIAYLIYFGNVPSSKLFQQYKKEDTALLENLLSNPQALSTMILHFRNQFPGSDILPCDRDMKSLALCIVDHWLLAALLGIYRDYQFQGQSKANAYKVIQSLVRFHLTVSTVKNMIKKLQIVDYQYLEDKWKNVFELLKTTLPEHTKIVDKLRQSQHIHLQIKEDSPMKGYESQQQNFQLQPEKPQAPKIIVEKNVLIFKQNSYFVFPIEKQMSSFFISFKSYRILDEYILLKLKNEQQQIWLTVRHIQNNQFQISLINIVNKSPIEMTKVQIEWNPFDKHILQCKVDQDTILFKFGTQSSSYDSLIAEESERTQKIYSETLRTKNIKPTQIQIGSKQQDIPAYITQLSVLQVSKRQLSSLKPNSSPSGTVNSLSLSLACQKYMNSSVSLVAVNSLTEILKKLGELELFLLVTAHVIKKVENQEVLLKMLREIIDFLECLVVFKGVVGVKLTQNLKMERFFNVRCLVWFASKYKKDPDVVFQILRMLAIRGIKKPLQFLQILSNIGLWKDISSKSHYKLIQKIQQTCLQVPAQKHPQMLQLLKKIILDLMLFYKDSQLVCEGLQDQYLIKHSQIIKLIYDVVSGQKTLIVIDFIIFLLKILYLVVDKTKNNDCIDTTIGFQLIVLSYRLLFSARQGQYQASLKDKNKSPIKKVGRANKLFSGNSKSLNMPLKYMNHDRDQESLSIKIQQALAWTNELLYTLEKQVLIKQQKIRYYDWDWDMKQSSNNSSIFLSNRPVFQKKAKAISQNKILTYCEHLQIIILSYNKNIFNMLVNYQFSQPQWEIYWKINLFDQKICTERFIQTLRMGNFQKIVWSDEKIIAVLKKSFNLVENGSYLKLPSKLIQSMKAENIMSIHNALVQIYLQKYEQTNLLQRQKCAQNILFILGNLPESVYSNTSLLRQQLAKQKRNLKMLEIIQKHLIIKQLIKEGFKLMSQLKKNENKDQLSSTILAFDESNQKKMGSQVISINTKTEPSEQEKSLDQSFNSTRKRNKTNEDLNLNVFSLDNVEFQQSFFEGVQTVKSSISTQKIKQSLQYYKLLANPAQMEAFYKISNLSQSKIQVKQQVQSHIDNFTLNIDLIIKILEEPSSQNQKINKLQSSIFFIDKHIYAFSKMIINQYLFMQIKPQNDTLRPKRKKSYKSGSYKFKQDSQQIFQQFLKDRRKSVYRMENLWSNVEKNNKDFWDIFFKSEKKNQSVDIMCNSLKLKGLIKIDYEKRQIELPKNMTTISNKFSVSGESQRQLVSQNISEAQLFGDVAVYQNEQFIDRDQEDMKNNTPLKQKNLSSLLSTKKGKNQFSVLYITTTKIYQGIIICGTNSLKFIEDKVPDEGFYDMICANEHERRDCSQIEKQRQDFQIYFNQKSTIIPKRYLYYDAAVEIYSLKLTYFFVFRKSKKRETFLHMYQNNKGTVKDEEHLIELTNKQTQRWLNGDISNFTYLMHLNDLSGRSFNDLSQYYIFPWVLTNYKSDKFNKKFISNQENYRDLSKPVGALNKKRLQEILSRYNESLKYQETQSYLYGSFCSNPAIICNYLVRLQPFSMFHYLLQSKQFDLADRIFYSIYNQFYCSYHNTGDYKELIPQFYSCPQFLRNRNKYKFGQKQNKEIVNDVQLPQWAFYQFNSCRKTKASKFETFQPEEHFVFRMRKCLQSPYVTYNIHNWIDLMFGIYNKKQKAMARNNLYISRLYKNQLNKARNEKNKETCLIFFKQFGQMPKDLFDRQHKAYKNDRSYYKVGNSQVFLISQFPDTPKSFFAENRFFAFWDQSLLSIVDIKNKSGLIQKSQNSVTKVELAERISSLKIISIQGTLEDKKSQAKLDLLMYLKAGKLFARQISITTFRKKLQIKQQKQSVMMHDRKFKILQVYEQEKLIIVVESFSIKFFSYQLRTNLLDKSGDMKSLIKQNGEQSISMCINKKLQLKMSLKMQFSQHKAKIEHLHICYSYGLVISIDTDRKVYITKTKQKQVQIVQNFRLKRLTHCQAILQMEVHQMGYIIILTSLSNIHLYNFMGDNVAILNSNILKQINKKMQSKIESKVDGTKAQNENKLATRQQQNARKKSNNDINVNDRINSIQIDVEDFQFGSKNYEEQLEEQKKQEKLDKNKGTVNKNEEKQEIKCFQIWNHESGQLAIGTNKGNFYRIDIYMNEDCQKVNFTNFVSKQKSNKDKQKKIIEMEKAGKNSIEHIYVNRVGRHWQCWVASSCQLFKIESQDYRHAEKRNEEYRKKYALQ